MLTNDNTILFIYEICVFVWLLLFARNLFIYLFFIAFPSVSCSTRHNTTGILGNSLQRSEVRCVLVEGNHEVMEDDAGERGHPAVSSLSGREVQKLGRVLWYSWILQTDQGET